LQHASGRRISWGEEKERRISKEQVFMRSSLAHRRKRGVGVGTPRLIKLVGKEQGR